MKKIEQNLPTPEEAPEEIKEEETQELEVEEESQPWEKLKIEEEAKLIEGYEKQSQLDNATKDNINNIIHQETDQKRIDFAQEWFEGHKDEIREKGYDIQSREDGYAIKIVNEMGGFDELKEKGEYKETKQAVDNLYVLRADLQKDDVPLESQFLILNLLNNKTERAERDLKTAQEKGDAANSTVKQQELTELFKIKKELSEKISGKDLTQEAEDNTEPLEGKEEYVDKYLFDYIDKQILERSDWNANKTISVLKELGCTTEKKGIIFKEIEVKDNEGNLSVKINPKNLIQYLEKNLAEKFAKERGEEWEMKNAARDIEMKKLIEREIKTLGESPEKTEQGIESIYDRVKKRLKTEFIEKDLKKKEKTREQLQEIKKEFKGEGKNPIEFINNVINRDGSLKDLKGDLKQDKDKIAGFLGEWGFETEDEQFEKFQEMMGKKGISYNEQAKKEKGFLEWILDLIFFVDSESKKSDIKK
ncbi:MAG: hypothetical protein ABH919_01370 [bacterium]